MGFPNREMKLPNRFAYLIAFLCLIPILVSCAFNKTPEKVRNVDLVFELNGRIVASAGDRAGFNASFNWRHYDLNRFDILLWGPLGLGKTSLTGRMDQVILTVPTGEKTLFNNYQQWMENELGFSLPIRFVAEWIRGRPVDEHSYQAVSFNEHGKLIHFEQLGWIVDLQRNPKSNVITRVVMTKGANRVAVLCNSWIELDDRAH